MITAAEGQHLCLHPITLARQQNSPIHPLIQPLSLSRHTLNNRPFPILQLCQPQLLRHLCRSRCPLDILLVGEDEQLGALELVLGEEGVELRFGQGEAGVVAGVDYVDDGWRRSVRGEMAVSEEAF